MGIDKDAGLNPCMKTFTATSTEVQQFEAATHIHKHVRYITLLVSRIQVGQLVHDLGTVPQNGMELQKAVKSLLQTIQFLIG